MGSVVGAKCDCGFEKEERLLGGGMMSFTSYCNFPFYCCDCKTMFEANIFMNKILCPKCRKYNVFPYDSEKTCSAAGDNTVFSWNTMLEIDRELLLTDGDYICPGCGNFSLKFFEMGCWD